MPMPQHAPERTRPDIDAPSRVTEPDIIPHPVENPIDREFEEIVRGLDANTAEHPHGDFIKKSTDVVVIPKEPADKEPDTGDKTPEVKEDEPGGSDKETIKLVVAGLDREISARAAAAANTRLDKELGEKRNFFSKLIVNAWKGHAMRDMYLTRYRIEAERAIREHKDIYYGDDTGVNATYKADTVTRYLQDFENDLILHEKAGETREKLDDSPEATLVKNTLYDLMRRAAKPGSGLTDRDAFNTEADTALHELALQHPEIKKFLESSDIFAHNLFDGWKAIEAVMSKEGIDIEEALERTDISVGEARAGARSEFHRRASDRLIERMSKTRIANLVNEDTLAITTAAIYGTLVATGKTVAAGAAIALSVPGVLGGVWAGMRESTRLKQERDKIAQDVAEGRYQLDETLEGRTGRLREVICDQTSIEGIRTNLLDSFFTKEEDTDRLTVTIDTPDKLREALQAIGDAKALIDTSDTRSRDLLHSSTRSLDKVRGDLMSDLATLQVEIRRMVPTMDDTFLEAMGVAPGEFDAVRAGDAKAFVGGVIDRYVGVHTGAGAIEQINQNMRARDRAFNMLRVHDVTRVTGVGVVVGWLSAAGSAEVGALISDRVAGVFEASGTPGEKATLLRSWLRGSSDTIVLAPTQEINISGTAITTLPEGYSLQGANSVYTLTGPQNLKVEGLKVDASGILTTDSLDSLKAAGMTVDVDTSNMTLAATQEKIAVTPQQFLDNHSSEMKTFKVDNWLNYGTPKSNLNELRLGGSHREANGDITIKSWFKGDSTDGKGYNYNPGQGAKNGSLQYSVTIGNKAFFFDIADNGGIRIPADHPAATSLFDKEGDLIANYGRAVEVVGEKDGVVHVNSVATEIGQKNITTLTDTVTTNTPEGTITYKIAGPPQTIERETILQPILFGPLARGGLQVPQRPQAQEAAPVPERSKAIAGPPERKAITAEPHGGWTADFQGPTKMQNGRRGSLYRSEYAAATQEEEENPTPPQTPPATPPPAPTSGGGAAEQEPQPPSPQEQTSQPQPAQPATSAASQTASAPSPEQQNQGQAQNQARSGTRSEASVRKEQLAQLDSQATTDQVADEAVDQARVRLAGTMSADQLEATLASIRTETVQARTNPEFINRLRVAMTPPERPPVGMVRIPQQVFSVSPLALDIAGNTIAGSLSQPDRQTISVSTDPEAIRAALRNVWRTSWQNLSAIVNRNVPLTSQERTAFEQAQEYATTVLGEIFRDPSIVDRLVTRNQERERRRQQRQQNNNQGQQGGGTSQNNGPRRGGQSRPRGQNGPNNRQA